MADADDQARYEAAKKDLIQALAKKRAIDKELSRLEVQIYHTEATYLTETSAQGAGNIIQGFDNYLKNQTITRRRNEVTDADRMFSTSSATYQRSLELAGDGDESPVDDGKSTSATGLTTITLAPARGSELTAAQQHKKQRDRDYQRKKRATNRQRSTTGVESDDESMSATSGRPANKRRRMADDD